ncbi:MAG: nucleotide exchange factor GrpE [Gammaproteobacteria bacterium]|nr:MAG: nucleotide exchange factor GrpE [Gammaproteobacteria bacterium]
MSEEQKEQVSEEESSAVTPLETEEVVEGSVEAEAQAQPTIESLSLQLKEAQGKADESWDGLLRVKAEMENLRRRSEKDVQSAHKFALEKFSKELLTVMDSLELGLESFQGKGESVDDLKKGVELTLQQLNAVFEKFNIKQVDPSGERFNPEYHQAMSMQQTADHEPNTVIAVFQKGYLLNERLLRPAMVVVSQQMTPPPETKKIDEQA